MNRLAKGGRGEKLRERLKMLSVTEVTNERDLGFLISPTERNTLIP